MGERENPRRQGRGVSDGLSVCSVRDSAAGLGGLRSRNRRLARRSRGDGCPGRPGRLLRDHSRFVDCARRRDEREILRCRAASIPADRLRAAGGEAVASVPRANLDRRTGFQSRVRLRALRRGRRESAAGADRRAAPHAGELPAGAPHINHDCPHHGDARRRVCAAGRSYGNRYWPIGAGSVAGGTPGPRRGISRGGPADAAAGRGRGDHELVTGRARSTGVVGHCADRRHRSRRTHARNTEEGRQRNGGLGRSLRSDRPALRFGAGSARRQDAALLSQEHAGAPEPFGFRAGAGLAVLCAASTARSRVEVPASAAVHGHGRFHRRLQHVDQRLRL